MFGSNSINRNDNKAKYIMPLKLIRHPNYNYFYDDNDLALIKTKQMIKFFVSNDRFIVNSICLPQMNARLDGFANVTGWGRMGEKRIRPDHLQIIELLSIDKNQCGMLIFQTRDPNCWDCNPVMRRILDSQTCYVDSVAPAVFNKNAIGRTNSG